MMVDGVATPPLQNKRSWLSSFIVGRVVYEGMIQTKMSHNGSFV